MAPSPRLILLLLPRWLLAAPILFIALFFSLSTHYHHGIVLAASSSPPSSVIIQCRSGWTNILQTIHPSQINDGYCDCPYDNADEPNTSACSGAMDGMWSGLDVSSAEETTGDTMTTTAYYFHCPQQPKLHLPLSRVNDGICDCCDGADELSWVASSPSSSSSVDTAPSPPSTTTTTPPSPCPDICNDVLAEERAAHAKFQSDYRIGNQRRLESISQYQQWYTDSQDKLRNLKEVELVSSTNDEANVDQLLREAKLSYARLWMSTVSEQVASTSTEPLIQLLLDDEEMYTVSDLAIFIISLCTLSAEISSDNVVGEKEGRCLALDRASLDVGILWNNDDSVGNNNDSLLPTFNRLVPTTDDSLIEYANQILARSDNEQDDARKKSDSRKSSRKKDAERGRRKPKEIRIEPEEVESDDDYAIPDVNDDDDEGGEELPEEVGGDQPLIMDNEALVQSLLKKVPIDRSLIKKQSMRVLNYQLDPINDNEAADDGDTSDVNEHDAEESITGTKQVDPMALTMVKSTISKYLSQITRGETSAASAARFVASVMQNGDSARRDLINLAIMTLYHCNVAFDDVAELVYSTSSSLRSTQEGSANESSCAPPWGNMLCPPRTVQVGGKTYPPAFVVEAARKRCNERQKSTEEVCVVAEEDDVEFPTSVSDGYYNYYAPQARTADDALTSYFLTTASQQIVPPGLSELRQRKNTIDEQKSSLMKRISDLENEIGDNNGTSKYGVDGELFILRGTCHKLEHGKYEYEVCIFGQATQRDIGQTHGGTNLGSWEAESIEDGQRKLKWGGGTKCWNGPVRSAEVYVTCGAETNLLTADEPETCRYVFTMESPIGCDERISI